MLIGACLCPPFCVKLSRVAAGAVAVPLFVELAHTSLLAPARMLIVGVSPVMVVACLWASQKLGLTFALAVGLLVVLPSALLFFTFISLSMRA